MVRRAGVTAAQAVGVGDEARDIEAARAAGIASAAVSWGDATPDLLASQARHWAASATSSSGVSLTSAFSPSPPLADLPPCWDTALGGMPCPVLKALRHPLIKQIRSLLRADRRRNDALSSRRMSRFPSASKTGVLSRFCLDA